MSKKWRNLFTIALMFALVFQIFSGSWKNIFVHAVGEEITENILTNLTVTVTDSNQSVTTAVYGSSEDVLLDYNWEQDAKVRLDYDWVLPNGHGYTDGATFSFTLPEQFTLFSGDLSFLLDSVEGPVGTFTVDASTNEAVMTFNDQIEVLENIQGSLWFEMSFDKTKFNNEVTQDIVFPIHGEEFFSFTIRFMPEINKNIKKTGEALPGPFNAKKIQWTVDVNRVSEAVYGSRMTDFIPAGLELDENSIDVYQLEIKLDGSAELITPAVDPSQYTVGTDPFFIELGDIDTAYRIIYETNIVDEDELTFTNNANFSHDANLTGEEDSDTVAVERGEHLAKRSSGYDRSTQTINWEIEYNYDENEIDHPELTDLFDASQELVSGTLQVYPVTLDANGDETLGAPITEGVDYTFVVIDPGVSPADTDERGFKLSFNNPINGAYQVVYQTQAIDPVTKNNTITNTVTESTYGKIGVGKRTIRPLVIEKSCPHVDYANQTMEWEITLHGEINDFSAGLVVMDDPGENMEFLPVTVAVYDSLGNVVPDTDYTVLYPISGLGESFEITFNKPISDTYSIQYSTAYVDLNGGISTFSNSAEVTWTEGVDYTASYKKADIDCTPVENVVHNGFKTGSYDATTKEITWDIGVNYNSMNLTNAVVVDELLQGQKLVDGSIEVYHMSINPDGSYTIGAMLDEMDYSNNSTEGTVEVELGVIHSPYYITFKTTYEGALIMDDIVYNHAKWYDGSEVVTDLTASVDIPYGGEYVNKTGSQDGEYVNWTLYINRGLSTFEDFHLVDRPSANQLIDEESFKLFSTTIDVNGNITKATGVPEDEYDITVSTEGSGQRFELTFTNTVDTAYILEYRTLIDADHGETVSNEVSFEGENVETVTTTEESEVVVTFSSGGGTGSGINRQLTVFKVDEADHEIKLEGATFKLDRFKSGSWQEFATETSNEDGEIVFDKLLSGTYRLIETSAPEGYVLFVDPIDFTVSVLDGDIELTVENEKIEEPGDTEEPLYNVDEDEVPLGTIEPEESTKPTDPLYTIDEDEVPLGTIEPPASSDDEGDKLPQTGETVPYLFYVFGSLLVISGIILGVRRKSS